MTFELTVLGSSSALPTSTKNLSAHVLNVHERFFLIDCGEATQIQIRKAGIKFNRINHIFISHLHGDHVFGLFGLFSSFNLIGRKASLHLYGHPDLQMLIDFYMDHFGKNTIFDIILHPVSPRKMERIYEDKCVDVFAFPLKHRIPTCGFLFREKAKPVNIKREAIAKYKLSIKQIKEIKEGKNIILDSGEEISNEELTMKPALLRSYAYCSDTAYYKKIIPLIRETDLLYHEATFMEKDKNLAKQTLHSTTIQAATIAKEAGVRRLIIGHFSTRYKSTDELLDEARSVFRDTFIAEELVKYKIENTLNMR